MSIKFVLHMKIFLLKFHFTGGPCHDYISFLLVLLPACTFLVKDETLFASSFYNHIVQFFANDVATTSWWCEV